LPGFMKPGNRASLLQRELSVTKFHGNTTLSGCCTSFVNSEGPCGLPAKREILRCAQDDNFTLSLYTCG
jgi:hypothetical protein